MIVAAVVLAGMAYAAEQNDVEFARPGGFSLTLDYRIPDGDGPFPTAIIVHGGGWAHGNKRMYVTPLFDVLAGAGYSWFTINYRLAPAYQFPAAVEDVESAVRWVKANAAKYKVDTSRIVLLGESAGGYLVAYAGAHPSSSDARVRAVVDFYGPNDLLIETEKLRSVPFDPAKPRPGLLDFLGFHTWQDAGAVQKLHDTSPANLVNKDMPPFLFIHGTADEMVPYEQSPNMCAAMKKAGVPCDVIAVEGDHHGMENWEKDAAMTHWKADMVAWLRRTLGE
jgi:alpha-L-fucosidase 2